MSTALDYDTGTRQRGLDRPAPELARAASHGPPRASRTALVEAPTRSPQRRWRHVIPPRASSQPASRPIADFGHRATESGGLPNPAPLLVNLTRCVVEILAGVRELDQLARWVTDAVFTNLMRRVTIAARSRAITGGQVKRPRLTVGEPIISAPRAGVVEAVIMVHQPTRSRAVAIRLEELEGRWRASAITVL